LGGGGPWLWGGSSVCDGLNRTTGELLLLPASANSYRFLGTDFPLQHTHTLKPRQRHLPNLYTVIPELRHIWFSPPRLGMETSERERFKNKTQKLNSALPQSWPKHPTARAREVNIFGFPLAPDDQDKSREQFMTKHAAFFIFFAPRKEHIFSLTLFPCAAC
jgi:hypothetical protein